MKVKCENLVICGNYKCRWNIDGRCGQDVISLDANGKCILEKPKSMEGGRPAQNRTDATTHGVLDY